MELSERGQAAREKALYLVRNGGGAAKTLWDAELAPRERRVFLLAAGLSDAWVNAKWDEMDTGKQRLIKAAMVRFHRRFSGLLAMVFVDGEGEEHVHG